MTALELMKKLRHGGTVVSSAECSPTEIYVAHEQDRFFVDDDFFGYVHRPKGVTPPLPGTGEDK